MVALTASNSSFQVAASCRLNFLLGSPRRLSSLTKAEQDMSNRLFLPTLAQDAEVLAAPI